MQSLLIIGYVWPEPSSSAAGYRMMQLLNFFKSRDYTITFATTARPSPYMEDLRELGIETKEIKLNDPGFDEFVKVLQPEIVIFDRFMIEEQFGWRISAHCAQAIKILDTEDLHCLRHYRELKASNKPGALKELDITKREIASIYRCDLTLIISEAEMEILTGEFQIPENLLQYLPFLTEKVTAEKKNALPSFDDRRDFVSIGNFLHRPNLDAVIFLKTNIWPLIHKELPEAKMNIFGAYPSQKIEQLHSPKTNFLIKGRAPVAADEVKKARVSLAALRFGAGLKGKLLEAMYCGTPSVTTPVGAEGMNGCFSWPGAITASPAAFAEEAVHFYIKKEAWTNAQNNGFEILHSRFDKAKHLETFWTALNKLKTNLIQHRQENFTGAMLTHHRTKSTYYLSRYIEIKNILEKERNK